LALRKNSPLSNKRSQEKCHNGTKEAKSFCHYLYNIDDIHACLQANFKIPLMEIFTCLSAKFAASVLKFLEQVSRPRQNALLK
jgi:hypothetical protein